MITDNIKSTLWHSFPEQPNPDKLIILFTDSLHYDIIYCKTIREGNRFLYFEDILLPDMVEALHKYEIELDRGFH